MHESPLIQLIILQRDIAAVDRVQNVLCPGNEQPDYCAVLLGNSVQNDFGRGAAKKDCLSAGDQGTEPVHLCSRVVEGRDAEEGVILLLAVVFLLHDGGVSNAAVFVQDCLGESCSTG